MEGRLEGGGVDRGIVEPVERAVGRLADACVVATVGTWTHMVDHADQPVLHRDALRHRPAHVVGNIDLASQSHRSPVLPSHQVEPLELYAKHKGRALDLVLLGGGHLLMTFLAFVHVLTLAQVLSPEVTRQSSVNVVSLSVK